MERNNNLQFETFSFIKTKIHQDTKMPRLHLNMHSTPSKQLRLTSIDKAKSQKTNTYLHISPQTERTNKNQERQTKYKIKFTPRKNYPTSRIQEGKLCNKIKQLKKINTELDELHRDLKQSFSHLQNYVRNQIPLLVQNFIIQFQTKSAELAHSLYQSKFIQSSISIENHSLYPEEPSQQVLQTAQWQDFRNTYIQNVKLITDKVLTQIQQFPWKDSQKALKTNQTQNFNGGQGEIEYSFASKRSFDRI